MTTTSDIPGDPIAAEIIAELSSADPQRLDRGAYTVENAVRLARAAGGLI